MTNEEFELKQLEGREYDRKSEASRQQLNRIIGWIVAILVILQLTN